MSNHTNRRCVQAFPRHISHYLFPRPHPPKPSVQGLSCQLGSRSRSVFTGSSCFFCWLQGFSGRFPFYSTGGKKKLDNSEPPKGCHLLPSGHHKEVLLLPDEDLLSPTFPKQRDVLSLEVANGRRQSRAGGLILSTSFPFWVETLFQNNLCRPGVSFFQALPVRKTIFSYSASSKSYRVSPSPASHNISYNSVFWWERN